MLSLLLPVRKFTGRLRCVYIQIKCSRKVQLSNRSILLRRCLTCWRRHGTNLIQKSISKLQSSIFLYISNLHGSTFSIARGGGGVLRCFAAAEFSDRYPDWTLKQYGGIRKVWSLNDLWLGSEISNAYNSFVCISLLLQFRLAYIVFGIFGKKIILSYNKKILLAVSRHAKLSQFHNLGCCGGLLILCKFGPSTAGQNVAPFSLTPIYS